MTSEIKTCVCCKEEIDNEHEFDEGRNKNRTGML